MGFDMSNHGTVDGLIKDTNYRKEVEGQADWFCIGVNTAVSILHVKFAKRMPGSMA